jgi:hypothetical protein
MHPQASGRLVTSLLLVAGGLLAIPANAGATFKVEQLPGGEYAGPIADGKQIQLRVRARAERGIVRIRCARVRTRFRIHDDGSFRAQKRNRRGRVVLRVRGRFANLIRARGRVTKLARRGSRCRQGAFRARLRNVAGVRQTTVSYGPYHVEPGHGGHDHGIGGNVIHDGVAKPCEDCYIVAMLPDLVDEEGASVNHATGAILHHIVLFNRNRSDATCNVPFILGEERFFAAGNERTMLVLPAGYGYRIDRGDAWLSLAHLVNMRSETRELNVEITFWYVETEPLREVKPFWFDINNCSNSEYMTPAGLHTERRDFTIPPEIAGRVLAVGGHLHTGGVAIELTNESRGGRRICRSVAGYGDDPAYAGQIESMRGCVGRQLGVLRTGEVVRLHSTYDSPEPQHDAMGIMLGYVAPQPGG